MSEGAETTGLEGATPAHRVSGSLLAHLPEGRTRWMDRYGSVLNVDCGYSGACTSSYYPATQEQTLLCLAGMIFSE